MSTTNVSTRLQADDTTLSAIDAIMEVLSLSDKLNDVERYALVLASLESAGHSTPAALKLLTKHAKQVKDDDRAAHNAMYKGDDDAPRYVDDNFKPTQHRSKIIAKAQGITDPWGIMSRLVPLSLNTVSAYRVAVTASAPHAAMTASANGSLGAIDFDAPAIPMRWTMRDFIAEKKINFWSAANGSMKSYLLRTIMVASLSDHKLLDREVRPGNWILVDPEMAQGDVQQLWKAVGMTNAMRDSIIYFGSVEGEPRMNLSEPEWQQFLTDVVVARKATHLVIDTASAAFGLDSLSHQAVTALYHSFLLPLSRKHGLTVIITHHERKGGARGNRADAAIGSTAWRDLADQHVTLAATSKLTFTPVKGKPGFFDTHRGFMAQFPKGRAVLEDRPLHFEAFGLMEQTREGDVTHSLDFKLRDEATVTPLETLLAVLGDEEMGYRALNDATGWAKDGTKFKSTLKKAREEGLIQQNNETKLYRKV